MLITFRFKKGLTNWGFPIYEFKILPKKDCLLKKELEASARTKSHLRGFSNGKLCYA